MIRICQIDEIPLLLPMAKKFFLEAEEPGVFNPKEFIATWQKVISSGGGVIFVDDNGSEFIAMLGVVFVAEPFANIITANETFFYSDGGNGGLLLRHAVKTLDAIGIKVFYLHHQISVKSDKLSKLYSKLGFKAKFVRYIREV